jgi:hypothetical protein
LLGDATLPRTARAEGITFHKIVDTDTLIPGTDETFRGFGASMFDDLVFV